MGAVLYEKLDDIVENMEWQCDINAALSGLVPILQAFRVANAVALSLDMTQDENNAMLATLTGLTVATGTILNCYPRGAETALFFDIDGNPVT